MFKTSFVLTNINSFQHLNSFKINCNFLPGLQEDNMYKKEEILQTFYLRLSE